MHAFRTINTLAALTILAALGRDASAQVKVDERYQLDMDGAVRIHNYNGSVTVRGWEKDSIRVTGTIAGKDRRAWFGGGRGGSAKMGVEGSDNNAPLAELTVMVPARARLSVRGAATSIDIRDFSGTIDATTLSGRLHIAGSPTEVMAETMDGDLEIEASPSFFRGRTAMGRVTWSGSSDDVTIVTVGGSITLAGTTLYRARMESISGSIKFAGLVKPDGRVTFDSHGGDITLGFGKATVAELAYDAPRGSIFGAEFTRDPKSPGQKFTSVPRGGVASKVRPANVTASTFKGRLVVQY
jgi:hypothetical protein